MNTVRFLVSFFALAVLLAALPGKAHARSQGQTLYVPTYSHIYHGVKTREFYLAATLSIRNVDPGHAITIVSAGYYDGKGKLLKELIKKPLKLPAFASTRYVIGEQDTAGGSGAKFLVRWKSDTPVNAPLVETIMIGSGSTQGISFTSRAVVIEE